MKKLTAIIELLGEENAQKVRDGITEIILDYVREDLNSLEVYLIDWEEMFDEIREEIKSDIREKVSKKYLKAANEKIDEMISEL